MAGPFFTEPSVALYADPWHGQLITLSLTMPTVQAWWVHTAVKALKVPCVGCVTTIRGPPRITPPPTGTLAVATSAVPAPPLSLALPAGVEPSAPDPPGVVVAVSDPPPQAARRAPPAPVTATIARTRRREGLRRREVGGAVRKRLVHARRNAPGRSRVRHARLRLGPWTLSWDARRPSAAR